MKQSGPVLLSVAALAAAFVFIPVGRSIAACTETSPGVHDCSGTVNGDYHADAGDDTITLDNTTNADSGIYGDDGNDTITNNGVVDGQVSGGNNNDTITNNGDVGSISGDDGDDTITNNSDVTGDIDGGAGDDTITVNNTVGNDVDAGDDNDEVIISGDDAQVGGTIDGGSGNDTLTFQFSSEYEDEIRDLEEQIRNAEASSGSVTWQGNLFSWVNFETLQAIIKWLGSYGETAPDVAMLDDDDLVEQMDPTDGDMWALLVVNRFGPHWFTLSDLYMDDGTELYVMCMDGEGNWVDDTSIDERLEDNGTKFFVNFQQNGLCGIFTVDTWSDDYDEDDE